MKRIKRLFSSKKKFVVLLGTVVLIVIGISLYFSASHKTGGELVIDCTYFRKLSTFDNGSIYLFLRNDGKKPVAINKIILDDIPLPDLALSELFDEEDMSDTELAPSLKVAEDDRILWYYTYPNPIPPGKIAKVVVKYNSPPYGLISIAAEDNRGKKYRSILQPENNPLRFTYIGFNKNSNKIYLYLENSSPEPMKIARIYINGQDVTTNAFRPWDELKPADKKCIEVNLKTPLTKGEFITAKVITTEGVSTESMVRVFSFFPVTTDSGNPVPDLNLDSENYIVSFNGDNSVFKYCNKDDNIIYNVLNCPTHAHGSWRNAGRKAISRTTVCRENNPYYLTYMHICKTAQKLGSFAFAEIPDTVKENPIGSSIWSLNSSEHTTQTIARIVKEAASPNSWLSVVQLTNDFRIEDFLHRIPISGEIRLIAYYAISRGAKGVFYRLPSWGSQDQELLKNETKTINLELQKLKKFLTVSESISLATCSQSQVEACTLQAGYEGIVLILINHDTKSTPDDFTYKPKINFMVKVKIPGGMKLEKIEEVTSDKVIPVNYDVRDGEIILSIDKLDITRQFLIKTTPLYETNKSQPLEVKNPTVIPMAISGKGTPEEILTEAKTVFNEINNLKWCPQNLEEYDKVIGLANNAISNSKDNVTILNAQKMIVDCYHNQAEHEKERDAFNRYIEMTERYHGKEQAVHEFIKAGNSYSASGQNFDAIYYFEESIARYPFHKLAAYAQYKTAVAYAAMGNDDRAIDNYRAVIIKYHQENEWIEKSYIALINMFSREKRYQCAVNTLYDLLNKLSSDTTPLTPNIKFCLGYSYYKEGNRQKAKKVFEQVVNDYPMSNWAKRARVFLSAL